MKHTRKLVTLIVVLAMVMMMAFSVSAADTPTKNDSITINNAKVGETYSLYKLFDLKVDNEITPVAYTYTVNSAWTAFFAEGGAGNQYITVNTAGAVSFVDGIDVAAFAKAAAEWSSKPAASKSVTVAEGATTAVFAGLDNGYYLITSTLGTIAMTETTPDAAAVTIDEKNPEDTIKKEVKEDSTGNYGDSNDAQIGDTIEFKSTVTLVKGTRNVVVHDKMDSGLTYTAGSVTITGLTKGTEYTVNENPTDNDTFDITFAETYINGLTEASTELTITYTAALNENAIKVDGTTVSIIDQKNVTSVSFGDASKSNASTSTTTTHKFSVYKHATGKTENLANAVFSLKKDSTVVNLIKINDTNYRIAKTGETGAVAQFTTVASGDIVIWGVDSDNDYSLEETAAPEGYNKLTEEKTVEVAADNSTRIDVENKSGSTLPSPGGMGTTIFYVLGGLLSVGALVVLVTNQRMRGTN